MGLLGTGLLRKDLEASVLGRLFEAVVVGFGRAVGEGIGGPACHVKRRVVAKLAPLFAAYSPLRLFFDCIKFVCRAIVGNFLLRATLGHLLFRGMTILIYPDTVRCLCNQLIL